MNLYDPPVAEDIEELGKSLEKQYGQSGGQSDLDERMHRLAMLTNKVEAVKDTVNSPRPAVKGFRSGLGWTLPNEQSSFMGGMPRLHVGNPTPEDKDLDAKIEGSFTPAMYAVWKKSQQAGAVWPRLAPDLKILGRAWDSVLPHPDMWADTAIQDHVKARAALDDPELIKKSDLGLAMLKAQKFPIRWVYTPPRGTWSTFEPEYWLPEVVEIREMGREGIIDRWGEKAIPGSIRDKSLPGSKFKIYIWANHCYSAVVIPGSGDSEVVSEFQHNFMRNPYDVAEAGLAPDNDRGIRWLGMMFAAESMIESLDEMMSDQRELMRDAPRTPRIWQIDSAMRGETDPLVAARAKGEQRNIVDGAVIDKSESIILAPVPQMNPEQDKFYARVQAMIERTQPPGIQRAEILSGQSQNTVQTSFAIANKQLDPYMTALADHAEAVVVRFCASIKCLDEDLPVFSLKNKVLISVSSDDADFIAMMIQATVGVAIPTDQTTTAQTMALYQNALGYDPAWVGQHIGDIEDSAQVQRLSFEARARAAAQEQVVIPMMIQRLQNPNPPVSPQQMQMVQALLQGASPDLVQFLTGVGSPPGAPSPGAGQPGAPPPGPPGMPMGGAPEPGAPVGNPMPSAPNNGAAQAGGGLTGPELQGMANQRRPMQQPQQPGMASGG